MKHNGVMKRQQGDNLKLLSRALIIGLGAFTAQHISIMLETAPFFVSATLIPAPSMETSHTPAPLMEASMETIKMGVSPEGRQNITLSAKAGVRPDVDCVDNDESCTAWAQSGECSNNAAYMHTNCRASCHICKSNRPQPKRVGRCEDTNANCATWAAIGECDSNPAYMLASCPLTCKMCQSDTCFDKHKDCAERCKGGAESNYSSNLMCYYKPELLDECTWTCSACKEHRFSRPACKRDPNAKAAAVPGSVDKIFTSISEREGATILSRDPWIIGIDDFLTPEEADEIVAAGSNDGTGWARSMAGDGVQTARTSSTAWCEGKCLQNSTVQRIEQRVSELLLGIPMDYSEPLQVLRYETGQYYKTHHDQNSPRASAWGPRMFTVYMYVADDYEGGQTHFPRVNVTVAPKKGRAAVWTSVLNSDPYQRDDRTDHESLPVSKGTKRGVNYWVHMYPFRSKTSKGCGNQAYIENWY